MILDKTHRSWALVSAVILAVAIASYMVYVRSFAPSGPKGGSLMGLIYGMLGTAMMVFAALLAARKLVPTWRIGSAQFWLRGHIWLGTLSVVFILFHSGFGWGGLLENWLWITFIVVIATGFFGLLLQQLLPRLLTTRIPLETFGAQLPYLCRRSQLLSDRLVAEQCGKLNVDDDPLFPLFQKLAEFGQTAKREDKDKWTQLADQSLRPLFSALAKHAKDQRWVARENEFPSLISKMYENVASEPPQKLAAAGQAADGAEKPKSKIEQMRAGATGKASGTAGEKPMSKIEQMRAAAANKKKSPAGSDQPASKIDRARAAAATKPSSKLQQARAQAGSAASKKTTAAGPPDQTDSATATTSASSNVKADTATIEEKADAVTKLLIERYGYNHEIATAVAGRAKDALLRDAEGDTTGENDETQDPASTTEPKQSAAPAAAAASGKPMSKVEQMRFAAGLKKGKQPMPAAARKKPAPAKKGPPGLRSKSAPPKNPNRLVPRASELKAFYLDEVRPFLSNRIRRSSRLTTPFQANQMFSQIRADLPAELHGILNQLAGRCEERRQFEIQRRIHRWLHYWLMLHIPFSIALVVLFLVHIVVALRVVPPM